MKDNRILIISDIGCGPPYMGNRKRMKALLVEIRNLGLEIYFAGIRLSNEEKTSVEPYIDHWITNFKEKERTSNIFLSWINRRLFRRTAKKKGFNFNSDLNVDSVDSLFNPIWIEKAQFIQKKYGFKRILVPYVYNSKFLDILSDIPIRIIDTHDVFRDRNKRLADVNIKKYWFSVSGSEEKRGLERASHIIAIQEEEADYFKSLVSENVVVKSVKHMINTTHKRRDVLNRKQFGFIGSDNPLNVNGFNWFSKKILPEVIKKIPDVKCIVAGSVCDKLPDNNLYDKIGRVDSVEDFYALCSFTINPIRAGTGLKIKTIESLEYHRPVISSSTGAEGLDEFKNMGLIICKTKREYVNEIINIIRAPSHTKHSEDREIKLEEMNQESRNNLQSLLSTG